MPVGMYVRSTSAAAGTHFEGGGGAYVGYVLVTRRPPPPPCLSPPAWLGGRRIYGRAASLVGGIFSGLGLWCAAGAALPPSEEVCGTGLSVRTTLRLAVVCYMDRSGGSRFRSACRIEEEYVGDRRRSAHSEFWGSRCLLGMWWSRAWAFGRRVLWETTCGNVGVISSVRCADMHSGSVWRM